jgi:diacylglycerol kinase
MWYRLRTVRNSFRYAWRGLAHVFRHEQNFRIQIVIALVVLLLMLVLRIQAWEAVALFGIMSVVLILEILNTVVERFVDILKPRLNEYSQIIKDMMAGAVFLAACAAAVIGAIIFYPYIVTLPG